MIINPDYYDFHDFDVVVDSISNLLMSRTPEDKKLHLLFISIAMSGRDQSKIEAEYKMYAEKVECLLGEDTDLYVIPTRLEGWEEAPVSALILKAMTLESVATIISFPYNFEKSRGCMMEYNLANDYLIDCNKAVILYNPKLADGDFIDFGQYIGFEKPGKPSITIPVFKEVVGCVPKEFGPYYVKGEGAF